MHPTKVEGSFVDVHDHHWKKERAILCYFVLFCFIFVNLYLLMAELFFVPSPFHDQMALEIKKLDRLGAGCELQANFT